jgi:hypothetical protein
LSESLHKTTYYLNRKEVQNKVYLNNPGKQLLKIIAEDQAGNISTYEQEINVYIPAEIEINPRIINLKGGNGHSVITAYIQLPKDYNLEDILLNTILLNGEVHWIVISTIPGIILIQILKFLGRNSFYPWYFGLWDIALPIIVIGSQFGLLFLIKYIK